MATAPRLRSSLRRTACDRCRHSKLRCFRDANQENQEKCARCLRLDLRCEVAPARPPGRPRKVISTTPAVSGLPADRDSASLRSPEICRGSPGPPQGAIPLPGESPEILSDFDDNQAITQSDDIPNHVSAYNGGGDSLSLVPVLPLSRLRGAEWYETSRFDSGFSLPPRDPLDVHNLFTAKLDRHECLKELSQLNMDLHTQWHVLQNLRDNDNVRFSTFTDHPPPPVGDSVSLAEKLLIMSQRFQQAITNLSWVVKNEPKCLCGTDTPPIAVSEDELILDPLLRGASGPSSTASRGRGAGSEQAPTEYNGKVTTQNGLLDTPFVCALVSCYVQVINLWEIMYFHVRRRIEGLDKDRLMLSDPSKGIQMGAFYIFSGRLQSMFFCQAVLYFLGNIDRALGILPEQREQGAPGLLSHPQHFSFLQRELGGLDGDGKSERTRILRDEIEWARLCSFKDVGW
ncbi:hypothetical protein AAE478_005226 [Parahypoxylon ruwenzoriense]